MQKFIIIFVLIVIKNVITVRGLLAYRNLEKIYKDKQLVLKLPYEIFERIRMRQLVPSNLFFIFSCIVLIKEEKSLRRYKEINDSITTDLKDIGEKRLWLFGQL